MNKFPLKHVKNMVADMETVETLLGRKGRFVGDMVHIGIKDLAECIRTQPPQDGWKDISSAPRDGDTRVLIYGEGFGVLAWSISDEDLPDGATHWQPLPLPPQPTKTEGDGS